MPKKVPRARLTDLTIEHLKQAGSSITYWDTILPAFGVRVGKSTKTFIAIQNGGSRIKIGRYPQVSLHDARNKARALLSSAPPKESSTFLDALETYYQTYVDRHYKPRTIQETKRLIDKHCLPIIKRSLQSLITKDITAILDALKPSEANHLFGVLRTFFIWCERNELIERSPLSRLTKPHKEQSRDRVLSVDELIRIWHATDQLKSFGIIVKLLILTGQRRGEIAGIKPQYISDNAITWPKEMTKNGREHTLPISTSVQHFVRSAAQLQHLGQTKGLA